LWLVGKEMALQNRIGVFLESVSADGPTVPLVLAVGLHMQASILFVTRFFTKSNCFVSCLRESLRVTTRTSLFDL
jgi:hypothetical protein